MREPIEILRCALSSRKHDLEYARCCEIEQRNKLTSQIQTVAMYTQKVAELEMAIKELDRECKIREEE